MLWSVWFWNGDDCGTFLKWGIVLVLNAILYMFVRYRMVSGSKCFMCLIFMSSGPVEVLFVLFEMANCTCVVVNCIYSVGRFLIVWSMCRLVSLVLCRVIFVKCLLKVFDLSMTVMAVLVSRRMILFCCVGDFMLDSFAMVHYQECRLCL